jgi:hypothetical protein
MTKYLFYENGAVYEVMEKIIVEPARPQITVWRMQIAYEVPKAKNTHSGYVMPLGFPQQIWLHERTSILRHTDIA